MTSVGTRIDGEDVPDVDLGVHLGQRERRARAGAHAQVGAPPRPEGGIGGDARRTLLEADRSAPAHRESAERTLRAARASAPRDNRGSRRRLA